MKLPPQAALVRRSELIRDHIEAFAAARCDDPLVWCGMPRFGSLAYFWMARPHRVPSELSSAQARLVQERQTSTRKRRSAGGTGVLVGRGVVFMASDSNMRRAQAPLHERFGPVSCPGSDVGAPYWRVRKLVRRAASLARELIDCARRHELELPLDAAAIATRLLRTARLIAYSEDLVARVSPRVVIAGSVLSPRGRALIYAARSASIPTVYIPHSAQASINLRLAALPADYVGLRGEREVAYLEGCGIDRARLDVIGNPTIASEPPPDIDPRLPPAFAAGLEDFRLAPLVEVIHEALGGDVTVGRHPGADPVPPEPVFPRQWRIFDGRTYDLLRAGPPVLLQHSSGIALEALHLGIPVVELQYPGKAPLYPLISQPHVRFATSSQELSAAVAAASADAGDESRRADLIDWAHSWSSPGGRQAGERAVALVERAIAQGPRGRVWDPSGHVTVAAPAG